MAGKTYSFPPDKGGGVQIDKQGDPVTIRVWLEKGKLKLNVSQQPRYSVSVLKSGEEEQPPKSDAG